MFLYLWVLFALFVLHQSIILAQEHINYQAQGFAIVSALILAKVMLIGEDLHLGSELRDKPLIYSILYKSLVFSVFLIGFHIVEEVVVGLIRGRSVAQNPWKKDLYSSSGDANLRKEYGPGAAGGTGWPASTESPFEYPQP
jgi:hypothetical protein